MKVELEAGELNIDPKDIERAVKEAVIHSALGEKMKAAITELLNQWDSPVKAAIQAEATAIIRELVQEEYKPLLKKAIHDRLTDKMVEEIG